MMFEKLSTEFDDVIVTTELATDGRFITRLISTVITMPIYNEYLDGEKVIVDFSEQEARNTHKYLSDSIASCYNLVKAAIAEE